MAQNDEKEWTTLPKRTDPFEGGLARDLIGSPFLGFFSWGLIGGTVLWVFLSLPPVGVLQWAWIWWPACMLGCGVLGALVLALDAFRREFFSQK